MRLGWVQALFVAGALMTYAGFFWKGAERLWLMFLPAGAAFVLSIGRGPLPLFLLLYFAATVAIGFASFRGGPSRVTLALMAASDLVLGLGLTVFQQETTRWSLPAPGGWEAGSFFIAGAAALRLMTAATEGRDDELSLVSLGWWQGIFLAAWAGSPARLPLGAASALLFLTAFRRRADGSASSLGMLVGGGAACFAAGLGLHPIAVFSVAAAGAAFALGERTLSMLVLAGLPVSAFWLETPDEVGPWSAGLALLIPVAVALVLRVLPRPGSFGGRISAAAAVGSALLLGMQNDALRLWVLYAGAASVAITWFATRPEDVPIQAVVRDVVDRKEGRFRSAAAILAYGAGVVTAVLVIRMAAIGFGTGFL